MPTTETHRFQAETSKLLNLVINSLYTSKDIFLRELISNASDALDRLRFEAVTNPDLLPEGHTPEIRLEVDREERNLTIHDNGIGVNGNVESPGIRLFGSSNTIDRNVIYENYGAVALWSATGVIGVLVAAAYTLVGEKDLAFDRIETVYGLGYRYTEAPEP